MRHLLTVVCLGALLVGACSPNQTGHLAATGTGDVTHGEPAFQPFDAALDEACGPGQPTAAGRTELGRLPYLQSVTSESARVLWTSRGAGTLSIRPGGSDHATERPAVVDAGAGPGGATQWLADVSELRPATIYCYRVAGPGGEPWTEWTGFRTAPGPGETVELTALGDLGEDTDDQQALLTVLEALPAQAVLITGDLAYPSGKPQHFEDHFFGVYQAMLGQVPFFPASGNHDQSGDTYQQVFSLPDNGGPDAEEGWYSFDWGQVHVVALDTERVGAAQAAWLDQDLARHADAPWTVVFLHRPPFSTGAHGNNASVERWFVPAFERGGVDLVLAGHDHDYERFLPRNGVTYVITGGGGRGTRPVTGGPDTAYAEDVIHLVHLRITSSELIGWAIDATGNAFDTFRIAADPGARAAR